jgi:hypothetical protein
MIADQKGQQGFLEKLKAGPTNVFWRFRQWANTGLAEHRVCRSAFISAN